MRAILVCVMFGLLSTSVQANDSFNSELSHFIGGAAMGPASRQLPIITAIGSRGAGSGSGFPPA